MKKERELDGLDRFTMRLDGVLRMALFPAAPTTGQSENYPAAEVSEAVMTNAEKTHAARLMRVNHVGEICAQGLYQGQALVAREGKVVRLLEDAADEERQHLEWCAVRLSELDYRVSYLSAFWYVASLALGAAAGSFSDQFSLGFMEETEHQVERHLDEHLQRLPAQDEKSRAILLQMQRDEVRHGKTAKRAGGKEVPSGIKALMRNMAKIMTKSTYWI